MKRWLYLGVAILFGVAAFALWHTAHSPTFWAGLVWVAVNAILPVLMKRKDPVEEAIDREYYKRNQVRPTKFNRHPGEGGHNR